MSRMWEVDPETRAKVRPLQRAIVEQQIKPPKPEEKKPVEKN